MHKLFLASLTAALVSCGAPPPPEVPPAAVQAPVVSAPASVAPPVEKPAPIQPALHASFDSAKLDRYLATLLPAIEASRLEGAERELGLGKGDLVKAQLARLCAIDTSRPIEIAVASLDSKDREAIQKGFAWLRTSKDESTRPARVLDTVVRESSGRSLHVQLVFPVTDPRNLLGLIPPMLDEMGWRTSSESVQGFDTVWTKRQQVLGISRQGDTIVVDYIAATVPSLKVISSLPKVSAGLRAGMEANPIALEGHMGRMLYAPSLLADVGYLHGLAEVSSAIRGVEKGYRDRLAGEGLQEAARGQELAGDSKGTYFNQVDLTLDGDSILPKFTGKAPHGPGSSPPGPGACEPSVSLEFPDPGAGFDVSSACIQAIRIPGDPDDKDLGRSKFLGLVRDAGWAGLPVGLPFLMLGGVRFGIMKAPSIPSAAVLRFERFGYTGQVALERGGVFWGILPASASQTDASCAVEAGGAPCKGRRVLLPNRVVDLGYSFAKLQRTGTRWVVLAARDKKALDGLAPALTKDPVPALRSSIAGRMFRKEFPLEVFKFPLESWRLEGSARIEPTQISVSIQPVPMSPAQPTP